VRYYNLQEWYSRLHLKPANYVLDKDTELRQLQYDMETAYNTFFTDIKELAART